MPKIGGGAKGGETHIANMIEKPDKASRAGRSRFKAQRAWMRPRSGTMACYHARDFRIPARSHPRKRGPCSTLWHATDFGHNPEGWHEFWPKALSRALSIFAIWPAARFAP